MDSGLTYRLVLLGGMLCVSPNAWPDQATGPDATSSPADPSKEVWGDPELADEGERDWTWFGMGYERRMRQAEPGSAESSQPDGGSNGNGGKDGK